MSNSNTESNKYHGNPCKKYGHTLRYKKTGHCVECMRMRVKKWCENNPEKHKETQDQWLKNNPDKRKKIQDRYRQNHIEELRERGKKWRANNKEYCKEYWGKYSLENKNAIKKKNKLYRANNPKKIKAKDKLYRKLNKKRLNKYSSDWRKKNPKKHLKYQQTRRARKNNVEIEPFDFNEICQKYDNKCLACGRTDVKLTIDHVIPIFKGGGDKENNIQPLCHSCNSKKGIEIIDYRPDRGNK